LRIIGDAKKTRANKFFGISARAVHASGLMEILRGIRCYFQSSPTAS